MEYGSTESSFRIDLGESIKLPNRFVFKLCRSRRNGNRSATMPWSGFTVSEADVWRMHRPEASDLPRVLSTP